MYRFLTITKCKNWAAYVKSLLQELGYFQLWNSEDVSMFLSPKTLKGDSVINLSKIVLLLFQHFQDGVLL